MRHPAQQQGHNRGTNGLAHVSYTEAAAEEV